MSNLEIIEAFSQIIETQASLINRMQAEMNLVGLRAYDFEIANVRDRYNAILGANEWPDIIIPEEIYNASRKSKEGLTG